MKRSINENPAGKDKIGSKMTQLHERCNLCGNQSAFLSEKGRSLREARCFTCGASVRNSDAARVIVDTFATKDITSREALPHLKDISIHESESPGPIHNILINSANYICSEYFKDITPGTIQDLFEHIKESLKAFSEIKRVLEPNGYRIFTACCTKVKMR